MEHNTTPWVDSYGHQIARGELIEFETLYSDTPHTLRGWVAQQLDDYRCEIMVVLPLGGGCVSMILDRANLLWFKGMPEAPNYFSKLGGV